MRFAPFVTGLALLLGMSFTACAMPASAATRLAAPPKTVRAYARVLRKFNPQLPDWQSRDLAKHVLVSSHRWRVDANVLVALVSVESAWHTHARSWAGAIGLGQLMPGTAAKLGVDPHNPYQNLSGAARYLSGLLARFHDKPNRYQLAFAAYNAGPQAVERFGGIPPFYETQHYVVKVMRAWHEIRKSVHVARERWPDGAALATLDGESDVSYWSAQRR